MICPFCEKEELEYQEEYDIFCDHYYCPSCDSTYSVQQYEELKWASSQE